jgi:hypothetical protein
MSSVSLIHKYKPYLTLYTVKLEEQSYKLEQNSPANGKTQDKASLWLIL